MGDLKISPEKLNEIITDLETEYFGVTYDVFKKNCNHFSNDL